MDMTRDFAYKLGVGRYVQERGAMRHLPDEIKRLGTRAYILCGEKSWQAAGGAVLSALEQGAVPFVRKAYIGPCCEQEAQRMADDARAQGLDVIVGVGGGRIMDLAKLVADIAGLPVVNVPTCCATCAAYTPLSVVYTPEGACLGSTYFRNSVNCVLCDDDVLAAQPPRLAAAGALDAMAKHIEIQHRIRSGEAPGVGGEVVALIARDLHDRLVRIMPAAMDALSRGEWDDRLHDMSFLCIAITGLCSGITRGMYQSALAHAVYESVRTLHTKTCAGALHGEIVAIGLIAQWLYLSEEEEARRLLSLMRAWGMPTKLSDIGMTADEQTLRDITQTYASVAIYTDPAQAEDFYRALRQAEQLEA